jgi:HEPN domain-containing protein
MQRDSDRADAPSKWLSNARADLAIARIALPPGGLYEQLCFHAQQAAEKSTKAVLLKMGINFPFTHNLQALIDLLPPGLPRASVPTDAVDLNPYAVTTRYPGESEPVTEEEYLDALRIAEAVVEWAESVLNNGEIGR